MIKLKDALALMEETTARGLPKPFSIVFCTADTNRKTGGDIIEYDKAILSRMRPKKGKFNSNPQLQTKSPLHFKNRTRNICQIGTDEIRKVHIDLILYLNGQPVV